ncbi:MAG: hypothetical protein ACREWE_16635 [Gammaproteobacteria bacterium]
MTAIPLIPTVRPRPASALLPWLSWLAVACGGGEAPRTSAAAPASQASAAQETPKIEACALLTSDEIEAATGWKVAKAEPSSHGATAVCNFSGPSEFSQTVSVVVAPGMPKVASSAEMADWRKKQTEGYGDVKFVITPIEGLGVPAIRNEIEGSQSATIEAAAKGVLLDVVSSSLEVSKALVAKAIGRLP